MNSGLLSAVLTITTLIAAGLAGLMLGSLRTLRDNNSDLQARVTILEDKVQERDAEIAILTSDREALARVVTGEAHLNALTDLLTEHHQQSMASWQGMKDIEERILTVISQEERILSRLQEGGM